MTSPAQDYFSLLGVDRRYDLDVSDVEKNYRELSKKSHPDRFVGAVASQRVAALQQSMSLNSAVKTLVDPVRRAEYLLGLHDVTIGDNERIPPGMIMDILEAREELSSVLASGNDQRLEELEEEMLDRRDELLLQVGKLFAAVSLQPTEPELMAIKDELILLRYVDRYLEQFDDADRDGQAA